MTDPTIISDNIHLTSLEDEMKTSYLDYAMSVIVGRALPDVRDGLKPVHRRVLFAMNELGNGYNGAHKKSARIVGDVIGKYHPHGDTAVYDAIVRMAQTFSMRNVLIDGQGNFGSVDGDAAAAMRYTEIRMARISHEMLADIDKNTVDFMPNYDESESEPLVLPTRVPNLLINGSSGIAVGMATNIPPHNLGEIIDATLALSHNPDISIDELITHVPGPDFPTAGEINGVAGVREAYHTGRGRLHLRAKSHFEEVSSDRKAIIITELPYATNKARLIERIAELVKEKKIESISALRDESDKQGMRIVIELKRGDVPEIVLNQLYKMTAIQSTFSFNMVALSDGKPCLLNLKQILEAFLAHRGEVVTRRSLFELAKARSRTHILEGLAIALANIDDMISIIRSSASPAEAKSMLLAKAWPAEVVKQMISAEGFEQSRPQNLPKNVGLTDKGVYQLSELQAQAILDLRLHRLTGLEQDKIHDEFQVLLSSIAELLEILRNSHKLLEVIRAELEDIKERYNSPRLTRITTDFQNLGIEDLIPREQRVVTMSYMGYVKTQPLTEYQTQGRGGKGRMAAATKQEDMVNRMFVANSHDTLLCFSSTGKVYWKKVYEIPIASRQARGKPIVNLLSLQENEVITAILPIQEYHEDQYILMVTRKGIIKKTPLTSYSRPRVNGIIALGLNEDDRMIGAMLTDGNQSILLFSRHGKSVHFKETSIRTVGRTAKGVIGMRMSDKDDAIIAMMTGESDAQVLTATELGYGKRTEIKEYPIKGRGGKGVISIKTSERNGLVSAAIMVSEEDEVMLISDGGTMVRIAVNQVSSTSRNTQGVRLIRLTKNESLVSVARIEKDEDEEADESPLDETEGLEADNAADQDSPSESTLDDSNQTEPEA